MSSQKQKTIANLKQIPGIGNSLATDLWHIGIKSVTDLKGKDPETLYEISNQYAQTVQDRCVLYVFRCAVYYANTEEKNRQAEKLKWWYWKDKK